MAFNITTDLVEINDCDAVTDWSASGGAGLTADTDFKKEGIASLSIKVSNSTKYLEYDPTGSWNLSGVHLYWWMNVSTYGILDTIANGGCLIRLTDTSSNYSEWHYAGNNTYTGGWKRFVLDVTKTPTATSGTLDLTIVDKITFFFTTTSSANLNNCYIDIIHYLASGNYALKGNQGTSGTPGTWADILTADASAGYGIVEEKAGVIFALGRMQFGDTTNSNDTYFADTNRIVVFQGPQYYTTSLTDMISDSYYKFNFVGESTKVTNIKFGDGTDTFGYSGGTITSEGPLWDWDSETDKADINSLTIYGSTFINAGTMQFGESSSTQKFITCTWDTCNEIQPNEAQIDHCTVMNSTDTTGAMEMIAAHDMLDVDFYNNSRGVHVPHSTALDFDGMNFSGNTYDVTHSHSGDLTINALNGANPSTTEETAGGSTTINNAKSLTVNVEDTGGSAIENAQVYIQKSATGKQWNYVSHSGNALNDIDFVVTGAIDTDLPQSGWLHVWEKDTNTKQNYRYQSWSTSTDTTFILRDAVTGTADTGGSGTTLKRKTGTAFTSADIEEGDAIYNSTDLSWAVVDEIVDDNTITTTPLQDGTTDDTWQEDDGYSLHKLVKSYTITDDKVDVPILNKQTEAGVVTGSYNYTSDLAVYIRVRYNQGTPKYVPLVTAGTIGTDGLTVTTVLQEDAVAT